MTEELKEINSKLNDEVDRLRVQLGEQMRLTSKWKNKYIKAIEENDLLNRENRALEDDNYRKCELNEELLKQNKQLLERIKRLEENGCNY